MLLCEKHVLKGRGGSSSRSPTAGNLMEPPEVPPTNLKEKNDRRGGWRRKRGGKPLLDSILPWPLLKGNVNGGANPTTPSTYIFFYNPYE